MPFGSHGFNPFVLIILILIVLQWFRVGCDRGDRDPERGLVNNGGLFIIAIFLLAACACKGNYRMMPPISPIRYSQC